MNSLLKRNILSSIAFSCLVIALSLTGCTQTLQSTQKSTPRIAQTRKFILYERPTVKPEISPDGFQFGSPHYTLTIAEGLQKAPEFSKIEERKAIGAGYILSLEGQYDFVKKLFGLEAKNKIHINLNQSDQGPIRSATTQVSPRMEFDGSQYQRVYEIEINFPLNMFDSIGVRAHELTHAFTSVYNIPTWFDEGIATLVEIEYAKAGSRRKYNPIKDAKVDENGINAIQTWRGHGTTPPGTYEYAYGYSYSILSELRKRYGDDFFPKLFALIEKDGLYNHSPLSTSVLVYYMNQAAGTDLIPFFREMKFNVQPLTKEQILNALIY